ncbi:hypothetical protein, partial [Pisciglobus halotolerans]|uniref:hypothetical protein n=1 Tax=Pisciglobus halotolerans TaxID=745365 RepID=UPI001C430916
FSSPFCGVGCRLEGSGNIDAPSGNILKACPRIGQTYLLNVSLRPIFGQDNELYFHSNLLFQECYQHVTL